MRYTLYLLLFLSFSTGFSQNCSKYFDDVQDLFDSKVIYSDEVTFSQPTISIARKIRFKITDDGRLYIEYGSSLSRDLAPGNTFTLHMSNNEVLEFPILFASQRKIGTVVTYFCHAWINDEETLKMLYNDKIERIEISSEEEKYDLSKKKQGTILSTVQCMVDSYGMNKLRFGSTCDQRMIPEAFKSSAMVIKMSSSNFDCKLEKDSLTPENVTSKFEEISAAPSYVNVQISRIDSKLIMTLQNSYDYGCLTESSYVIFHFTNKESFRVDKLNNYNKEQNAFSIDITGFRDMLEKSNIDFMRISLSESYLDIELSQEDYIKKILKTCF